ncbi:MAG TPA: glycosyltransferase, partial [Thermodesulfobacteriota bacterium]|nr:glycosyltransferase [Thermodesulfobacteriota bacterium]
GAEGAAARLVPRLAPFRPDVVHALHAYRSGPAGVAAARALGAALVVGLRGTDVWVDLGDPDRRGTVLAVLEAADAVLALSAALLEPVLAARPSLAARSAVVPHGVAEPFFAPPDDWPQRLPRGWPARPPEGTLFLLPANVRAIKGLDLAVAGMARLAATRPGVRLVVVGPVLEAEAAARLAEAAAAHPWLALPGEVPHADMPALYRAADVVLNTSLAEGMSNAVLEAMAAGRPVLVSDIPAHRTAVEPEVTGLVFDPAGPDGGAAALARQAARLADDPALRARLGLAAAARIRAGFTADAEARRTLAVYEAALARRTARVR